MRLRFCFSLLLIFLLSGCAATLEASKESGFDSFEGNDFSFRFPSGWTVSESATKNFEVVRLKNRKGTAMTISIGDAPIDRLTVEVARKLNKRFLSDAEVREVDSGYLQVGGHLCFMTRYKPQNATSPKTAAQIVTAIRKHRIFYIQGVENRFFKSYPLESLLESWNWK
ncbi:MAG TPA: hypothetical protein DD435_05165 [Cyanobacteria bacterium UBA8530]|nr:hypothetical protein [Cyanobacteria bacterium UBA8530]